MTQRKNAENEQSLALATSKFQTTIVSHVASDVARG